MEIYLQSSINYLLFSDSFSFLKNICYQRSLPEQFIEGLTTASFEGRAQIVPDRYTDVECPDELVFYLDGAHSPESMEACGRWFSAAVRHNQLGNLNHQSEDNGSGTSSNKLQGYDNDEARKKSVQVDIYLSSTFPSSFYCLLRKSRP